MSDQKYRLITRSDMDGLVCAALLYELDMIDEVKFAHPKDVQDGVVEIGQRDIVANLPYAGNPHLVLDHHRSESLRVGEKTNVINDPDAPSAARVVYKHFGGADKFPNISEDLIDATDKIDAAQLSKKEILEPDGWVMLGFIMDNRTGLGRYRDFRISNYQLMMDMIGYLRQYKNAEDILNLPDVKERVDLYRAHADAARKQMERCSKVYDGLLVLDLREEEEIHPINRFAIYALYPDCNISMHIMWGREKMNTVFAVGKSIIHRTSHVDVGKLMLEYGGGGHKAVGTCQVANDIAEQVKEQLVNRIIDDN